MPPFASAAEARRASIAEQLESPEAPLESASELALKRGKQETEQTKAWLDSDAIRSTASEEAAREYDKLIAEADAAFSDFSTEVESIKTAPSAPQEAPRFVSSGSDTSDIDSGWERAPESQERPTTPEKRADNLRASLASPSFSFQALEACADLASRDKQFSAQTLETLKGAVGSRYAERLLQDASFRAELNELQSTLIKPIHENGPAYCKETPLKHLLSVHELFGNRLQSMVQALDLTRYQQENTSGLRYLKTKDREGNEYPVPLLKIHRADIDSQGNFETIHIEAEYSYDVVDAQGEPTEDTAQISRVFSQTLSEYDEHGAPKMERTVSHDLFSLPESIKGNGLAAEVTRASLSEYDALDIDAITLEASQNTGGYAWASYGYGWNLRQMTPKKIQTLIEKMHAKITDALTKSGVPLENPTIASVLTNLLKAKDHPTACTPQFLAALGKDGPRLRRGATGAWYTEESFATAIAAGKEPGEKTSMRGPLHLGKIGLMGEKWNGAIELKSQGAQAGKNRALLEAKLAATTAKNL